MSDMFVLRIPTAPQYSFAELRLSFDSYEELDGKIDKLHNGLVVKLSAVAITAAEMAKMGDVSKGALDEWETRGKEPVKGDSEPASPEVLKRELGAKMVETYPTPPPWENPPAADSRPAPPWATAPSPPQAVKGSLNLDDF